MVASNISLASKMWQGTSKNDSSTEQGLDELPSQNILITLSKVPLVLRYVVFALFIFGTTGNLTAFAVLSRKSFRQSSTAILLRALAIFDSLCLLISFLWVINDVLSHTNKLFCFLIDYFLLVSIDLSNWTLVLVTAERLVAILLPHRASQILSKKSAATVVGCLVVFMLIFDSHDLILYNHTKWDYCIIVYNIEPYKSIKRVFFSLNTIKVLFIPYPFIMISSVIIVATLRRQRHAVLSTGALGAESNPYEIETICESTDNVRAPGLHKNKNNDMNLEDHKQDKQISYQKKMPVNLASLKARIIRERSLTITLLVINFCFMATRLPHETINIYIGVRNNHAPSLGDMVITGIAGVISLFNNSINVVLYIATGSRFRKEFKDLMKTVWIKIKP